MDQVFLLPGDSVTTRRPARLATLLGSCVSVCVSNIFQHTAGMNHYMLPEAPGTSERGKYGDTSIRQMLKALLSRDPDPQHYWARVYGGASVLGHLGPFGDIGQRNIEVARRVLGEFAIGIRHEEVGGNRGRRLEFDTQKDIIDCRTVGERAAAPRRRAASASIRVLIVDDSPAERRKLRRGLESCEGITVVGEASDAFEARDQVLSLDPDVLSLDVEMPQAEGMTFLRRLMRHLAKPVVVMSSLATPGSELEARVRAAGAVDVIDKSRLEPPSGSNGIRSVLAPALRRAARSWHGK
jgi:chemotaxis receptor (MCP) glutamine deamidase CheD/CheY-like chemotaxis protein